MSSIRVFDNLFTQDEINSFKIFVQSQDESTHPYGSSKHIYHNIIRKKLQSIDKKLITYDHINYCYNNSGEGTGIHKDNDRGGETTHGVIVYLSEHFEGGETNFYDDSFNLIQSVIPKINRTIIYDINLNHSGQDVKNGIKMWIGTEIKQLKINIL